VRANTLTLINLYRVMATISKQVTPAGELRL